MFWNWNYQIVIDSAGLAALKKKKKKTENRFLASKWSGYFFNITFHRPKPKQKHEYQ
jgi:hypothetical protein